MSNKISHFPNYRYLLYFFSLIAGWPCVFYLMGWLPNYTVNYIVLFILVLLYAIFRRTFAIPRPIWILIVAQCIAWLIYSVIHNFDTSYFTRIFMLCVTSIILAIQTRYRNLEFIKTYNFWLAFQAFAGTIGFVLVMTGILHPIFEFIEMDTRPGYFFGLFTTNTYVEGFVRNAGFFDEPGALAFWGIIALLINKLYVDNRKVEIILIFGLISTLSMAYFIQLALYIWFFYRKKWLKILLPALLFLVVLKGLASYNDRLDRAIFGRFEYDEETGTLAGDNRSELMDICWDIFKTAPVFGQGSRHLIEISKEKNMFFGANTFYTLASDGIVGLLIFWSPFFYLFSLRKYSKKYEWAFWILIAGFLQRPYDGTQLLYPLLCFSIILHAYFTIQKERNEFINIKY